MAIIDKPKSKEYTTKVEHDILDYTLKYVTNQFIKEHLDMKFQDTTEWEYTLQKLEDNTINIQSLTVWETGLERDIADKKVIDCVDLPHANLVKVIFQRMLKDTKC
jgi:hypothetical protein